MITFIIYSAFTAVCYINWHTCYTIGSNRRKVTKYTNIIIQVKCSPWTDEKAFEATMYTERQKSEQVQCTTSILT